MLYHHGVGAVRPKGRDDKTLCPKQNKSHCPTTTTKISRPESGVKAKRKDCQRQSFQPVEKRPARGISRQAVKTGKDK